MSGPTGLDYAGVRAYLDELGIDGDERKDIFRGVLAAERGSLEGWAEKAERTKQQGGR